MRSGVVEPFRKVLRPLIRWVLQPHIGVHDAVDHTVPVPLKQPSLFTIVMTIILSPVIFFILLPLLIVLFPAALIIGTIAMLVPLFSEEMGGNVSLGRPIAKHAT